MTKRLAGTGLFAVAFVVMGLPDFGHGVAWPTMRDDLDRPLADLGVLLTMASAGYLIVALATGRLVDRWTVEGLVLRSTLSSAVGLVLVALAPVWGLALVGMFLAGAGAGGMDTGFNAAVALRADGRLMGLLHAGYGIGAAIGPLVVGAALVAGDAWRVGYGVFALASLVLVAPLLGRSLGDPVVEDHEGGSPRGMLLPCMTFLVYVGLEIAVGQWAFTYLTEERGMGELLAASFVTVYWIGLTAGRLWLGTLGHRLAVDRVLLGSVVGALAGTALLWLGGPVSPLGLPVTGLALSVVFPLLMLVTPARVGAERAAAAIGWQTASSSIGGAAAPFLTGVVLDGVGVHAFGPMALGLAVLLATCVVALEVGPRESVVEGVIE
jgi:fucose permease